MASRCLKFNLWNSDASAPKRMKIQQRYLEKVGFTPSCIKCRALLRGDKTVTTGHSPECRIRVEAEMMKHEDLRDELEKANSRINEYIAKKIEENGKRRFGWPVKRPGERSSSSSGNAHDVGLSGGTKGQERKTLRIWMNLLRSKDWLKLMVQSAKENKRSLTRKVKRGLG